MRLLWSYDLLIGDFRTRFYPLNGWIYIQPREFLPDKAIVALPTRLQSRLYSSEPTRLLYHKRNAPLTINHISYLRNFLDGRT